MKEKNDKHGDVDAVSTILGRLREILQAGAGDLIRAAELAMDRQESAGKALAEMVEVRKVLKAGDDEDLVAVASRRMGLLTKLDTIAVKVENERDDFADQVKRLQRRFDDQTGLLTLAVEERDKALSELRDVRAELRVGDKFDGSVGDAAHLIRLRLREHEQEIMFLRKELQRAIDGVVHLPAVLDVREDPGQCGRDGVLLDLLIEALGDTRIILDAGKIRLLREVLS